MIRRFSYFGAPDEVSSEAKPSSQEKQLRQLCRGGDEAAANEIHVERHRSDVCFHT